MFVQPRDDVLASRIALNKILSRAHSNDSSIKMSNIFNDSAQDQVNNLTNAKKRLPFQLLIITQVTVKKQ